MPIITKSRGTTRTRGAKKARVPALSKGMKTAIKRVVASKEELKYVAYQNEDKTVYTSVSSVAGANLYQMFPPVLQGTTASDRIGNAITPKSIRTHFAMWLPSGITNSVNCYVRLLCLSSREVKSYSGTSSLEGDNLFLDGAGGSQDIPSVGGSTDLSVNLTKNQFLPVNRKSWIVHHDKIYHLTKNVGTQNNQGRDATNGTDPNTPAATYHRITVSTPHKGQIKYDYPADDVANNFAPYWCAYVWSSDGVATFDFSGRVTIASRSEMYFTE